MAHALLGDPLSQSAPGSAVPVPLMPLLGRDQETATLRQLLRRPDVRLITLSGRGGVGQTSLALRVAHEAQVSFSDGVFFISLAPISDPTLIAPTIAQTLSLPASPHRLWLDSLKDYLHDRQVLLLLDNFEQIITAAPLLTELLSACAELWMLVTSREALRLRERVLTPKNGSGTSSVKWYMWRDRDRITKQRLLLRSRNLGQSRILGVMTMPWTM